RGSHDGWGSISYEKVTPSAMRSVISHAHVLEHDVISVDSATCGWRNSARPLIRQAFCIKNPAPSQKRDYFRWGCFLALEALRPGGVPLHLGGAVGLALATGQDVHLHLGLGAGGTDDDGGAIHQLVAQHVGAGQLHGGAVAGGGVHHAAVLVVLP